MKGPTPPPPADPEEAHWQPKHLNLVRTLLARALSCVSEPLVSVVNPLARHGQCRPHT